MVEVISRWDNYGDPAWILARLGEQGYEASRVEDVIVVVCEGTDDPDSEEASSFLDELRLDLPCFNVDDVMTRGGR